MELVGDLLHEALADAPQLPAETHRRPLRDETPVTTLICSSAGTLALARQGVDVGDALKVAESLARHARMRARELAASLGMSEILVRRTRQALRRIPGLEGFGRSWAPVAVEGQLSKVPTWSGQRRWLLAVSIAVLSPAGKSAIARQKSSRPMVLRVARQDAASADGRSGRGVRTSHETVARRLGVSVDAVRHARYVLESLGLSVTIVRGRYLTGPERKRAAIYHGGRQRRIASTRALTLPKRAAAFLARHLPRSGSVPATSTESSKSPRRAGKASPRRNLSAQPQPALPYKRLAAQLALLVPDLAQNHIGNLVRGLQRLQIDPAQWTGHRILHLVELRNRARGWTQPADTRSPLRLFLHQVKEALSAPQNHRE